MKGLLLIGGLILVQPAIAAAQNSNPGLKAVANASTEIVVAEVLETNPRKAIEGARDTAQLKVLRTLKGSLEPEQNFGIYHHLLWTDRKDLTLEPPKFEKGHRYTVFLQRGSSIPSTYTLSDQWLAVLPEHPRFDSEVAEALNAVDELWSDYWRRQHKVPGVSNRRIEIVPEDTVERTKEGLVLSVKITNHSDSEIRTHLAHEWHGGLWPRTELYASVTSGRAKTTAAFEPVFLVGESPELTPETVIEPGKSITVKLRMDWPGTGSVMGTPLMTTDNRQYKVRLLMVFSAQRSTLEYATGEAKDVKIAAE